MKASERVEERPRRRKSQALARAAARCRTPLRVRWTVPCQVPALRAGVFWMMKKAAESSQINAVKARRTWGKESGVGLPWDSPEDEIRGSFGCASG